MSASINPIPQSLLGAGDEALSLPVRVVLVEPRISASVGVHHQTLDFDQLRPDALVLPGQPLNVVRPPLLHTAEVLLWDVTGVGYTMKGYTGYVHLSRCTA